MKEARPTGTNMGLRALLEQLTDDPEGAVAVIGEGAGESTGGLVGALLPHGAANVGEVRASVLEDELERGDGLVGCSKRIRHGVAGTLRAPPLAGGRSAESSGQGLCDTRVTRRPIGAGATGVRRVRNARRTSGVTRGHGFVSPRGKTFLVVRLSLSAVGSGDERDVSSRAGSLTGADGVLYPAIGGGQGAVCVHCVFDLGTNAPQLSFAIVFTVARATAAQSFAFRYAPRAAPVVLSLSGAPDLAVARLHGVEAPAPVSDWTIVRPGGKARCARGGRYAFLVRLCDPRRLLVYFGAGRGCLDYRSCAPKTATFTDRVAELDPRKSTDRRDFRPRQSENPFRHYTVVYVPS
jgi:hypothetical protein